MVNETDVKKSIIKKIFTPLTSIINFKLMQFAVIMATVDKHFEIKGFYLVKLIYN